MRRETAVPESTIRFLSDWRYALEGSVERGGQLRLEYDKERLSRCFTQWRGAEVGDTVAYVRFHPRGEIVSRSVLAPIHDRENPPGVIIGHRSIPVVVEIPVDATWAEIWFHNFHQTSSRCDAWDSRFGENYWFGVGGPTVRSSAHPVQHRSGAATRPDVVNVLEQACIKANAFPPPPTGGPHQGKNLQTTLKVVAWVKETAFGANAWIDVHVFDGGDGLVHSETLALRYTGFGSAFRYEFSGQVYQGSTATPGSVQPRPDARKIQFRLYYEVKYQVYTDGILHQCEVQEDAVTL